MLQRCLPTRENLLRCGAFEPGNEPKCCWFSRVKETEDNPFAKCEFANEIWYKIFHWLGVSMIRFGDLFCLARKLLFMS